MSWRGLRSRSWAVEWDEKAIDFLLEKGFSENLGARPLKRAIERYLLSPLAETIVNHQFPEGDQFLFVTGREERLDVEFIDPDAPEPPPTSELDLGRPPERKPSAQLESYALHAEGVPEELPYLRAEYERLLAITQSKKWTESKQTALSLISEPDFWSSDERFEILGQYEYQDRIEGGLRRAGSLLERLSTGRYWQRLPRHLVGNLAHDLYLLRSACGDVKESRPREAFLFVEGHKAAHITKPQEANFAARLASMYLCWAKRRRMQHEVIEEPKRESNRAYRFILAVSGYGAYSILAPEQGIHVMESPEAGERAFGRRQVVVRVIPQLYPPAKCHADDKLGLAERALSSQPSGSLKIVRRYRWEPSPLVRDSLRGWRTGKIEQVLGGDFDLIRGSG